MRIFMTLKKSQQTIKKRENITTAVTSNRDVYLYEHYINKESKFIFNRNDMYKQYESSNKIIDRKNPPRGLKILPMDIMSAKKV